MKYTYEYRSITKRSYKTCATFKKINKKKENKNNIKNIHSELIICIYKYLITSLHWKTSAGSKFHVL